MNNLKELTFEQAVQKNLISVPLKNRILYAVNKRMGYSNEHTESITMNRIVNLISITYLKQTPNVGNGLSGEYIRLYKKIRQK